MSRGPVVDAPALSVLRPLSRRPPIAPSSESQALPWRSSVVAPRTPLWRVGLRLIQWGLRLILLGLALTIDSLLRRRTPTRDGHRLRRFFEGLGGTATKLAQQLSVRVDMLPFEVCEVLGRMRDQMPPMRFEDAVHTVEEEMGRPLQEIYASFEREPIGSASIACVYRARLHDGTVVAVKVRRPDVLARFSADLRCLEIMTRLLELTGAVRPAFFHYLRRDMRAMFMQEMDFWREGRYQRLFRRMVKRQRIKGFTAPKTWPELTTHAVLVTTYVDAVPIDRIIRAQETGDVARLEEYAAQGITAKRVARQLMLLALWGRLDCPFFHSDPHPGNLLVMPGGRLMVLDFGSCCHRPPRLARLDDAFAYHLVRDEMSSCAEMAIAMVAPFDRIDLHELRRKLAVANWRTRLIDLSKGVEWWERTSMSVHLTIMEVLKEFNVRINSLMLQFMRSSLLYDTLACRLDPDMRAQTLYPRHVRKSLRRRARIARRRLEQEFRDGAAPRLLSELSAVADTAQRAVFWLESITLQPRVSFVQTLAKSAFALLVLLRVGFVAFTLAVGSVALMWLMGPHAEPLSLMLRVLGHPAYLTLIGGLVLLASRRVWLEITDPDPRG